MYKFYTYLMYICRFLDHATILFMLLRTWESIVIEVIIN